MESGQKEADNEGVGVELGMSPLMKPGQMDTFCLGPCLSPETFCLLFLSLGGGGSMLKLLLNYHTEMKDLQIIEIPEEKGEKWFKNMPSPTHHHYLSSFACSLVSYNYYIKKKSFSSMVHTNQTKSRSVGVTISLSLSESLSQPPFTVFRNPPRASGRRSCSDRFFISCSLLLCLLDGQ